MLLQRTCAALAFSALLVGILAADYYLIGGDVLFNALVLVLTVVVLREFCAMCQAAGVQPLRGFAIASSLVLLVLMWLSLPKGNSAFAGLVLSGGEELLQAALAALILGMFFAHAWRRGTSGSVGGVGATVFGVMYVWYLPSFLVRMRHFGPGGLELDGLPPRAGASWLWLGGGCVVATIAVSKLNDVFAYLVGRKYGRHRLAPWLSPAKSWEGAAAGLAASVAAAFFLRLTPLFDFLNLRQALIFGVVVGLAGMFGDLAESLLKRGAQLKDSGKAIPGYGGVLDVVDSIIFAAPVAYYLLLVMLK